MKTQHLVLIFLLGLLTGVLVNFSRLPIQTVLASRDDDEHQKKKPTPTTITTSSSETLGGFYKNLSGTNLEMVFLAYHNFTGFNFTDAIIRNSRIMYADFTNANLTNTDFTGSDLTGINLTNANLTGIKWYNCPEGDGVCGSTKCPDGHSITTDGASCF